MTQRAENYKSFAEMIRNAQKQRFYPYFHPVSRSFGSEVEIDGHRLIMIGSNDYLGLSHDPRVVDAAANAVREWGTGPGGSRFLSGNMTLHEQLEERLAAFVGKKKALVHTTGFMTNAGAVSTLTDDKDIILCDREDHASILEGCRSTTAKINIFAHNDARKLATRIASLDSRQSEGSFLVITEGVFSMSGDVSVLPEIVEVKRRNPRVQIYLDDAHGLGVMGAGGHGTASHFGVAKDMDFIMGTFSKAMASIGGFIASDDEDAMIYVKHHSKTLIFSAALPAANVAAVLACIDILEKEPSRVDHLRTITKKVRDGYRRIGLCTRESITPIIPIYIGDEFKAYHFAQDLFDNGIFAMPAIFPAVPRGQAIIRTAYMSTHEDAQVDRVLETLDGLARRYGVRQSDFTGREPFLRGQAVPASPGT